MWHYFTQLGLVVNLPWLIVGDFNQVTIQSEKHGGTPLVSARLRQFLDTIHSCAWIDLGFSGNAFTWSNMRKGRFQVQERLDRAFGNQLWLDLFPNTRVHHLPRSRSDHHPISIQDGSLSARSGKSNVFRVQAAWFCHPQFEQFLVDSWGVNVNVGLVQ